jgi:hypothetical protein
VFRCLPSECCSSCFVSVNDRRGWMRRTEGDLGWDAWCQPCLFPGPQLLSSPLLPIYNASRMHRPTRTRATLFPHVYVCVDETTQRGIDVNGHITAVMLMKCCRLALVELEQQEVDEGADRWGGRRVAAGRCQKQTWSAGGRSASSIGTYDAYASTYNKKIIDYIHYN